MTQAVCVDSKTIVDELIRDIEDSTYMGAAWLVLTQTQKDRLKSRWQKIIDQLPVERDWANY